jgi:hypothetical protein
MSLWRGLTSIVSRGAMLSNAKNVSEEPPLDLGDQIISQMIKRELVMFTASRHKKVRDREHIER